MSDITSLYTPSEAWDELLKKRRNYVRPMAATWSGSHQELKATARYGSFWKRNGKAKIHVPLAADIASVSADMLFCERPRFSIYDDKTEKGESVKQSRLDEIIRKNGLYNKLHEAAELASAGGDVFLKINYDQNARDYPVLMVVSTEYALPEWRLGELVCVHFFTLIKQERDGTRYWRLYERYERGKIWSGVYQGDSGRLGTEVPGMLEELGLEEELTLPVDLIAAVQVFNMKPSRIRNSPDDNGRSDFEGQRDQLDALDEAMSSWLRDIRLGKARLLLPVEYLRKRPDGMFSGDNKYTWEFDEDVETLVALNIANDKDMSVPDPVGAARKDRRNADPEHHQHGRIQPSVFRSGYRRIRAKRNSSPDQGKEILHHQRQKDQLLGCAPGAHHDRAAPARPGNLPHRRHP